MQTKIGRRIRIERERANMNQVELAKAIGVSQGALSGYETGRVQSIPAEVVGAVAVALSIPIGRLDERLASIPSDVAENPNAEVRIDSCLNVKRVPVVGVAQARDYEASLMPVIEWAHEISDEPAMHFCDAEEGDIAMVVEGHSMTPWYPPGTRLLVRPGEYPERGDIVVAREADGNVIVKRYHRRNSVITLEALNEGDDGATITWDIKKEPGRIQWMWPVIAIQRNERRVRQAKARMGR